MRVAVELYNHLFKRIGFGDGFEQLDVTVRWNAVGSCKLTLPTTIRNGLGQLVTNEHAAKLLIPGTRVLVRATPEGAPEFQLFSGPVVKRSAAGPRKVATITAECDSDWRLFRNVLGWPVPGSVITSQSSAEFWTGTGPAETVIKNLVAANVVARLGRPVTVAPDLARGATVTGSIRFTPLADTIATLAEQGGLGVTVTQGPTGLIVDIVEGVDRTTRTFNETNGVVTSWSYASTEADATRAVGGGPGEGTAREFRAAVDASRETAEHDVIETLLDITDATSGTDLATKTAAGLAPLGATATLGVELSETSAARYGKSFVVGDLLRMGVLDDLDESGVEVVDVLREATLTFTAADGPVITPTVGDPLAGAPEKTLAKRLQGLTQAIRERKAR